MAGRYFLKKWEKSMIGGEDYWVQAEAFVQVGGPARFQKVDRCVRDARPGAINPVLHPVGTYRAGISSSSGKNIGSGSILKIPRLPQLKSARATVSGERQIKSTFAELCARQMEKHLYTSSGSTLRKNLELRKCLRKYEAHDSMYQILARFANVRMDRKLQLDKAETSLSSSDGKVVKGWG
ncbi:hypothetical protein K438DRAFT_1770065 [Mycena galopus ATCC 62051]|nr:hypothetical protein K438DRAFT_1770065 [Mycena galopus ATCC 62051]